MLAAKPIMTAGEIPKPAHRTVAAVEQTRRLPAAHLAVEQFS